eukprot:Lithocolla_globosa_v1_NODE_4659_length_1392_cov_5.667913.p2 type:complete len:133 gc:universal NODE_4659_length_1392_cov_5.667913:586-984(+)
MSAGHSAKTPSQYSGISQSASLASVWRHSVVKAPSASVKMEQFTQQLLFKSLQTELVVNTQPGKQQGSVAHVALSPQSHSSSERGSQIRLPQMPGFKTGRVPGASRQTPRLPRVKQTSTSVHPENSSKRMLS